jgi:hypothetical protein
VLSTKECIAESLRVSTYLVMGDKVGDVVGDGKKRMHRVGNVQESWEP